MSPDGTLRASTPMARPLWLDRGATLDSADARLLNGGVCLAAISRSSSMGVEEGLGSVWLVLRGAAQLTSREGEFRLQSGSWIALGRESRPTLLVDRDALVLALLTPASPSSAFAIELPGLPTIFPGRGQLTPRDRRLAFHLWRMAHAISGQAGEGEANGDFVARMLFFLSTLQGDLSGPLARCPGRTLWRRQQVLARMQRAALFLDGNHHRTVRLEELARISNFSIWYFTKTFHAIYGCGSRELTNRVRLQAAASLLARTQLSIGEVGSRCGFQNACSFARAFRAYHGASASSYRRSCVEHPTFGQSLSANSAIRGGTHR